MDTLSFHPKLMRSVELFQLRAHGLKGLFGRVEPSGTLFDVLYALRRKKVLRRVSS